MDPTLRARIIARLKDEISHLAPQMHAAAKYAVDHPAAFGLDSIRETARKAGVSTYTLVKMAKHMGFSSFDSFRAPFRTALLANNPEAANPGWLDDARAAGGGGAAFAEAAQNARAIVLHSLEDQELAAMTAVVDTLLAAKRVYITGMRASYAMAYYLHYVGRMALPGMELIPRNMGSAIDDLSDAGSGDVLVAMTVTPYSRETIEACTFAQSKGLKLIIISDSQIVSPMLKPDHTLVANLQSSHRFACYCGMTALIEALIAMLMHHGEAPARARIESYENLRQTSQAYWSERKT